MSLNRRGHTAIEMIVALGLGAMVIGFGAAIGFRHQRFHRDVVRAVERGEQLDQLLALAPISLRAIAPGEGDIAPGNARDTVLEFRATIASAIACDSSDTRVLLPPLDASPRLTSILARPQAGDTAWFLVLDEQEQWVPRAISAVFDSTATCAIGGTLTFGGLATSSVALRLEVPAPPVASVLRITRPWRYSVYKSSDGEWYLGAKEWNPELTKFNTIQPVAGPVMSANAGGLRFRYLDSLGTQLPEVPPDPRQIAAVEVAFRVDSVIPGKYDHATSIRGRSKVVIALRNRP